MTPTRRASPSPAPRCRFVTLRPPDFALDPDALRAAIEGGRGRVRAVLRQHAAQPDRPGAEPRRAPDGGRRLHRARPGLHHRRGLRAPRLRRRAHPAGDAARDGRADADDLQRGQVLLGHRLEDRLVQRPGAAGGGDAHGQAVPHLRRRHAAPACRRGGAAPPPLRARRAARRPARQARPALRRPGRRGPGADRARRHLLHQRRRGDRRRPVVRHPARALRHRRHPHQRLLRRQGAPRRRWCASPSASGPRSSPRPPRLAALSA